MPVQNWAPAKVDGFGVFVALGGTSTTGKTFSALRMGTGIARERGGELAVLDTEGGRTHHYADRFKFRVSDMVAPFHPLRFSDAAVDAEKNGFAALVIDNFSLEWSGAGGVLDLQEAELEAKVAADRRNMPEDEKRKKHLRSSWINPKAPHKRMMQTLLQCRMPIIFCIRANLFEDMEESDKDKRKKWKPEQDKRFIYEWTVSFLLHPDTPGKPRYDLPHKCEDQHRHLFPAGEFITEEAGAALWKWANGDRRELPDPTRKPKAAARTATEGDGLKSARTDQSSPPPAGASEAPATSAAGDIFPGDLPSKYETMQETAADVAARKAVAFRHDLTANILKQRSADSIRALLEHKPVKARMLRLLESHPAEHKAVMEAVAQQTRALAQ